MDRPIKLALGRQLHTPGPPMLTQGHSKSCTALVPISEEGSLGADSIQNSLLFESILEGRSNSPTQQQQQQHNTTSSSSLSTLPVVEPVSRAQCMSTPLPQRSWDFAPEVIRPLSVNKAHLVAPPLKHESTPCHQSTSEPAELPGSFPSDASPGAAETSSLALDSTRHPWAVPALESTILNPSMIPPDFTYIPRKHNTSRDPPRKAIYASSSSSDISGSSSSSAGGRRYHRRNKTPQDMKEIESNLQQRELSPCPPYSECPAHCHQTCLHIHGDQYSVSSRNCLATAGEITLSGACGVITGSIDKAILMERMNANHPAFITESRGGKLCASQHSSSASCYSPVGIISELESPQSDAIPGYNNTSTTTGAFSFSIQDVIDIDTSPDSAAAKDSLKRKLSLYRKAYDEVADLRLENRRLRDLTESNARRISQLKESIGSGKEQESSLKNAISNLESRLTSANNDRVDILDGFEEACTIVNSLLSRQKSLTAELESAKAQLAKTTPRYKIPESPLGKRTPVSVSVSVSGTPKVDTCSNWSTTHSPLQDLRGLEITRRDPQLPSSPPDIVRTTKSHEALKSPLRKGSPRLEKIADLEAQLAAAQTDSSRLSGLLLNELRRQSRRAALRDRPVPRDVADDAATKTGEKTRQILADVSKGDGDAATAAISPTADGDGSQNQAAPDATQLLERELQHCIEEILMYKLDVRGYKKDLRRARTKIQELQASTLPPLPTPEQIHSSSTASASAPASTATAASPFTTNPNQSPASNNATSGLGINVSPRPAPLPPTTPARERPAHSSPKLVKPSRAAGTTTENPTASLSQPQATAVAAAAAATAAKATATALSSPTQHSTASTPTHQVPHHHHRQHSQSQSQSQSQLQTQMKSPSSAAGRASYINKALPRIPEPSKTPPGTTTRSSPQVSATSAPQQNTWPRMRVGPNMMPAKVIEAAFGGGGGGGGIGGETGLVHIGRF